MDTKKMHRKKMDAIDNFLERYETESMLVQTRSIIVESISPPTVFELKSQVLEPRSKALEPKSKSVEQKSQSFEMRATPKSETAEKKKYFYNKKNARKDDSPDLDYGKPSTTVGEPRTVYWPLKKDIIHHGAPPRSMQKPHDLNTSLP